MGPGSIDEAATVNGGRFVSANREVEPVQRGPGRTEPVSQDDYRAGGLGLTLKRDHQRMTIDDSG